MGAPTGRDVAQDISVSDLAGIIGPGHVRTASGADAVDGVTPRLVAEPGSVEELSELMKLASRSGLRVAVRGGGTKLGWGNPPEALDLVVRTSRLNRLLEHSAGDLVAHVQAGLGLEELQARLGEVGQMLALDPPGQGCTVGGVVATDASGPLRLRYGTVRDLLIGITVVLADGTVARSGGKVVKNVAGYDLGKLYTGSLGTLGIIAEATFRLHPRPEASRTVVAHVRTPESAGKLVHDLAVSTLVPSAVELEWESGSDGGTLYLLFEGITAGVDAQTHTASELARAYGECRVAAGQEQAEIWRRLRALPWEGRPGIGLKLTCVPTAVPRIVRALLAEPVAGGVRVRARAATGVVLASLECGDMARCAARVTHLREAAAQADGAVVVLQAAPELKRLVDAWGPVGDALPLMRRVKERFDPQRTLNPGRFVGGI